MILPTLDANHIWGGPGGPAETPADLRCLQLMLLQGSPWDVMSVLTCEQQKWIWNQQNQNRTSSLISHCLFQSGVATNFIPNTLQSADVHAGPVSSDTPVANHVVFVPQRFARWSTWHGAAFPPSLRWVGVLSTRFLLGTVLLHWIQ